jgi:hypothetical protein
MDLLFRLVGQDAQYRLPVSKAWQFWYTGEELGDFLRRYCIVRIP